MSEAGSVTSTLTAESSGFVAAYDRANLALQRSRAALAETKAAMLGAGGATDELKAKADAFKASMLASQAALERAKAGVLEFGQAAEHSGDKMHEMARGMRFAASASLTLEGQMQHSGHALVGILMGFENPMMLAAMAVGVGMEQFAKHMGVVGEEAKKSVDDAKKQLDELHDAVTSADNELKALARGADVGRIAAESRARELEGIAREKVQHFQDTFGDATDNGKKIDDFRTMAEAGSVAAKAVVEAYDDMKDSALRFGLAQKTVVDMVAKSQLKEVLDDEKKAQEGATRAAETEAAFEKRMDREIAKVAATPSSQADLAAGFSKLQNPLESSSTHSATGAPLGIDITHISAFEHVLDATAEEMSAFTGGLDEGHTAIHDTLGELADLGRQALQNTNDSRHFSDAIQSAHDALNVAFSPENLDKTVGDFAKAVAGGHGGNAAMSAAGGMIGGVVDVASGGATMGLGATLGSVLGGIFGDSLDKLVTSLGVLTPLFDAVGDVVASLTPILEPLKIVFQNLKTIIDIGLAKPLLALARPFGDIMGIVAELGAALDPWIGLVLDFAVSLLAVIPIFDLLHTPMRDFVLLLGELATASTGLYNGFVGINNAIVEWVRNINIAGVQPFKDFGELMDTLTPATNANSAATNANTTQIKKLNDNFNNLPSGYKIAPLLQAADAGVRQQINIQQVMVVARSGNLIEQIHRELVHRHGVNRGGGGGPEDDHN